VACFVQREVNGSSKDQVRHRVHEEFPCERAHHRVSLGGLVSSRTMVKKMICTLRIPSYSGGDSQTYNDGANVLARYFFRPSALWAELDERPRGLSVVITESGLGRNRCTRQSWLRRKAR